MNLLHRDFLEKLLREPSPSGWEYKAQQIWIHQMKQFADTLQSDTYGNAWATLKSKRAGAKTILLESHVDEVGFIVQKITEDGFLRVAQIGGMDAQLASARAVEIMGSQGTVAGFFGTVAAHMIDSSSSGSGRKKLASQYLDIGAKTSKEVRELGIEVGTPMVYRQDISMLGERYLVARGLDNTISGYILARVLEELHSRQHELACHVVFVNAVQEEIGGAGIRMLMERVQPDAALCLDVVPATDVPQSNSDQYGQISCGAGPVIAHGSCTHPRLVESIEQCAHNNNISLQHEAAGVRSGTDTDSIYALKGGIASALLSVPLRYMHSPTELVDCEDVQQMVALCSRFLLSMEEGQDFSHRFQL